MKVNGILCEITFVVLWILHAINSVFQDFCNTLKFLSKDTWFQAFGACRKLTGQLKSLKNI